MLTLVYRGRHDREKEVVSCYEAADRGKRIARAEGGGTEEARLDHVVGLTFQEVMRLWKCHGIG
jgi:hypothetical protein